MKTMGIIVFAAIIGFSTISCSNGSTDSKVVEAMYRFSGGTWSTFDKNTFAISDVAGAVSALGENTFTVTGGGINISYTGVYTESGGEISQ